MARVIHDDAGDYRIVAINEAGEASTAISRISIIREFSRISKTAAKLTDKCYTFSDKARHESKERDKLSARDERRRSPSVGPRSLSRHSSNYLRADTPSSFRSGFSRGNSPLPDHLFKDDIEIDASEHVEVDARDDTIAVVFHRVTPNDSGIHTVVANATRGKYLERPKCLIMYVCSS